MDSVDVVLVADKARAADLKAVVARLQQPAAHINAKPPRAAPVAGATARD